MSQDEVNDTELGKRPSALRTGTSQRDQFAALASQTQDERWASLAADDDLIDANYSYDNDTEGLGLGLAREKHRAPREKRPAAATKPKAEPKPSSGPRQAPLFSQNVHTQRLDVESMLRKLETPAADDDVDSGLLQQLLRGNGDSDDDDDGADAGVGADLIQNVLFGAPAKAETEEKEIAIPIEPTKQSNVLVFHAEEATQPSTGARSGAHNQQHKQQQQQFAAVKTESVPGGSAAAPNFVGSAAAVGPMEIKAEIKAEVEDDLHGFEPAAVTKQPAAAREADVGGLSSDTQFFWFDAKEVGSGAAVDAGSVVLFGKVAQETTRGTVWHSCCVRVRNVQRCVLILPRAGVDELQAVTDINAVCRAAHIENRRIKAVERFYAFEEPNVPRDKSTWLKLRYPAAFPPFPSHLLKTAQFVSGASRSLVELFLIKRKLMGPSLLSIRDLTPVAAERRISHCAFEFTVDDPKKVTPQQSPVAPKLTALSIQLSAQLDASGSKNEIFAVALTVCRDVDANGGSKRVPPCKHFVAVRPFDRSTSLPLETEQVCRKRNLTCVKICDSEAALLQWLVERWKEIDPDIIIGHNFTSFTLDVLLHRFAELRTTNWSIIGRLMLRQIPKLQSGAGGTRDSTYQERETCVGRLICDTYLLSREYFKSNNYKLLFLAHIMGVDGITGAVTLQQADETIPVVTRATMTDANALFEMLTRCLNATALALGVAYHIDVIPLTKRLCSLAGTLWSRTLNGSRAERIEYLLMHAFHKLKFVTPDKKQYGETAKKHPRDEGLVDGGGDGANDDDDDGKKKAKYKGGMVLEPKRGLYTDYVLLLDFNSLYPSLIQEFNICFTTVQRGEGIDSEIPDQQALVCSICAVAGAPAPCPHRCILPKVISNLVQRRREVKRMMKSERDESQRAQLNIRQLALKLTANSMYGCLGFEHSRFYAQPLAELVTRQGRQALQSTVDLVPTVNASLQVIYGDTDSVMIQTGVRDDLALVREMAEKIKAEVNKRYRSLEIDIDGVFRSILLSRKKKYAALNVLDFQGQGVQLKKEVKGLDMVRRDWCPLVKRCCDDILDKLLGSDGGDALDFITTYMQAVALHVRRGDRFELKEFVISKSLTKEPEHYKDGSFPHASVALRMKERSEPVRVGDLIPYVICESDASGGGGGGGAAKLSAKAFHVDEVRREPRRIDAEWYLETQIFPPVMRLCEVIEGFSAAHLAESMGLKAQPVMANRDAPEALLTAEYSAAFRASNLEECFPRAEVFQIACPKCARMTVIQPHARVDAMLKEQPRVPEHEPFPVYVCHECRAAIPVPFVTNNLVMLCNRYIRRFYKNGGTRDELVRLRQQISYFRALLDVPHMPGARRDQKEMHRTKALRCIDKDNKLCTIAQYEEDASIANPPLDYIKLVYNLMDSMSVSLPSVTRAFHLQD